MTGKTVITLTAINRLIYERWEARRVLVIAPKKVAEATWSTEAAKWDHLKHLRIVTILGTEKQRVAALHQPGDVYVINRENVVWLMDTLRNRWDFDTVVIDESSSFKNPKARRFRALKAVRSRIKRMVLLTGTPAPNGYEDLWAQLFLLDGGKRLGRTITAYRDAYFTQDYVRPGQMYRTYTLRKGEAENIRKVISDICVSMSAEDYLSLPECIYETIQVKLSASAERQYKKLERDMLLEVDDQTITATSAAVLNAKLLQLCSGAVYDADGTAAEVHDGKVEAFQELVEQLHGEHALVFYWFKHEEERIRIALNRCGLVVKTYTNAQDADDWNAGKVDILLAQPSSCGYGLNLQGGGHHVVWFGLPNWNLELYQQANRRVYRQGQDRPVIIHHLIVQGGMDEAVVAALHSKGDTQKELMQAIKARIKGVKG